MTWKNIANVTRSGLDLTITTDEPHGLSTGDVVRFHAAGGLWALEGWDHSVTIGAPPAGLGIVEVTYNAGANETSIRHASYTDPVLKKVRFGPVVIDGIHYPNVTGWSNYGYLKLPGDLTNTITTSSTVWEFTADDGPHTFVPPTDPTKTEFTITLPSPVYIADWLGGGMVACPWSEPSCADRAGRFWPVNRLETATITGTDVGELVLDNLKNWNRGLRWLGASVPITVIWPGEDVSCTMIALADCNSAVHVAGFYAGDGVFDLYVPKSESLYSGGEFPGMHTITGDTGDTERPADYTLIDLKGGHIIDALQIHFDDPNPTASVLFVGAHFSAAHDFGAVVSKQNTVGTIIQTGHDGIDHIGPRKEHRQWNLRYSLGTGGDAAAADRWMRTGQQMLMQARDEDSITGDRLVTAMVTVLQSSPITHEIGGYTNAAIIKESKMANNDPIKLRLAQGGDAHLRALYELVDRAAGIEQAIAGGGINPENRPNVTDSLWTAQTVSTNGSNQIALTFSPAFVSNPTSGRFEFLADATITGAAPTVKIDANASIPLKDADGNALPDGAIIAGRITTFSVVGGEARLSNYIAPVATGVIQADAVWDAAAGRYNVTTGQGLTTLATGQVFRLTPDIPNPPNPGTGTQIKIDGAPAQTLKYKRNGLVYDIIPDEFSAPMEMMFDGANLVAVGRLSVPTTLEYKTISTYGTTYYTPPTGAWRELDISEMPANPMLTKNGNKIKALQPGIFSITGATRHRNGNVSLRIFIAGNGGLITKFNAVSGEYAYITTNTHALALDAGDEVWVEYYAYTGCQLRRDVNKIFLGFIGRP